MNQKILTILAVLSTGAWAEEPWGTVDLQACLILQFVSECRLVSGRRRERCCLAKQALLPF